jgi:hypothetical protein
MPKPKPTEELDSFTIRPPRSIGKAVRELARESGVPVNTYLVAILTEAARRGTMTRQRITWDIEHDATKGIALPPGTADPQLFRYPPTDPTKIAAPNLNDQNQKPATTTQPPPTPQAPPKKPRPS